MCAISKFDGKAKNFQRTLCTFTFTLFYQGQSSPTEVACVNPIRCKTIQIKCIDIKILHIGGHENTHYYSQELKVINWPCFVLAQKMTALHRQKTPSSLFKSQSRPLLCLENTGLKLTLEPPSHCPAPHS